jgi:hypothetical protein
LRPKQSTTCSRKVPLGSAKRFFSASRSIASTRESLPVVGKQYVNVYRRIVTSPSCSVSAKIDGAINAVASEAPSIHRSHGRRLAGIAARG